MRKQFWEKLDGDQRNFKWFHDNFIKEKVVVDVAYNTLYQQAKGEILKSMDDGLKKAIQGYLRSK